MWTLAGWGAVGVLAVLLALPVGLVIVGLVQHEATNSTDSPATDAAPPVQGCREPAPTTPGAGESQLPLRSLCALPPEAAQEWSSIESGKRHSARDGIVYPNTGRELPRRKPGYYHEYTVPVHGDGTRSALRLITGEQGELYYTEDHRAFTVVDPTATH